MPDAYQLIEKGIRKALENGESPERVLAEAREDIYSASEEENPFEEDARTRLIRSAPYFQTFSDDTVVAAAFKDRDMADIRRMIFEEELGEDFPPSGAKELLDSSKVESKAVHRLAKAFSYLEDIEEDDIDSESRSQLRELKNEIMILRKKLKEKILHPVDDFQKVAERRDQLC